MKTQPTLENTEEDLIVFPPGKQKQDKFFVGFWEKEKLIAVLDLIAAYPNAHTAFIGLFMVAKEEQGKQTGSKNSSVSCSNTSNRKASRQQDLPMSKPIRRASISGKRMDLY